MFIYLPSKKQPHQNRQGHYLHQSTLFVGRSAPGTGGATRVGALPGFISGPGELLNPIKVPAGITIAATLGCMY